MTLVRLDYERGVVAPLPVVHTALSNLLYEKGFRIENAHRDSIEAKRGNQLAGAWNVEQLPISVHVRLAVEGPHCHGWFRFEDQLWSIGGTAYGMNASYRKLFDELQTALDAKLTELSPNSAQYFQPTRFWSKTPDIAVLEQSNEAIRSVGATAAAQAKALFAGANPSAGADALRAAGAALGQRAQHFMEGRKPQPTSFTERVRFELPDAIAEFDAPEVHAQLGIARLIVEHPGAMPERLVADIDRVAVTVDRALATEARLLTIRLDESAKPVLSFLCQQTTIRSRLEVRISHTCKTCRNQKLTNPDYQYLAERNRKLRILGGSVGAVIGAGGLQPFVLAGALFKFAKLDPDFVCGRCQGMECTEQLVTFCPGCAKLRPESALRLCQDCKYDFRTGLENETRWQPRVSDHHDN